MLPGSFKFICIVAFWANAVQREEESEAFIIRTERKEERGAQVSSKGEKKICISV